MVSGSFRFVPWQALSSRVPGPGERARYMSAVSAVQHLASAAGAMIGAQVLTEQPDGSLRGMDELAWFAVATAAVLPVLIYMVDRLVRAGEPGAGGSSAVDALAGARPVEGS
jgi:predicted MFS family arabinose efflux permease